MRNAWFLLRAPRSKDDKSQRALHPFVAGFCFLSLQARGTASRPQRRKQPHAQGSFFTRFITDFFSAWFHFVLLTSVMKSNLDFKFSVDVHSQSEAPSLPPPNRSSFHLRFTYMSSWSIWDQTACMADWLCCPRYYISIASSSLGRRWGLKNVEERAHTFTHVHTHTCARERFFDVGTELLHSGSPLQQLCRWWMHHHAAVVMCLFLLLCLSWLSTPGEPWNPFVPLLAWGLPEVLLIRWSELSELMRFSLISWCCLVHLNVFFLSWITGKVKPKHSQTGFCVTNVNVELCKTTGKTIFLHFWEIHYDVHKAFDILFSVKEGGE